MKEQRKSRRFELKLPFELVRSGTTRTHQTGETRNISSTGVLIWSEARIDPGEAVEYMITLPAPPDRPVQLRCLGKIVRLGGESELAATLERYEFVRKAIEAVA